MKNVDIFRDRPKEYPTIYDLVEYLIKTEIRQLTTHQSGTINVITKEVIIVTL